MFGFAKLALIRHISGTVYPMAIRGISAVMIAEKSALNFKMRRRD